MEPRELRIDNIVDLGIVKGVYPSDGDIYSIWLHNGLSFSSDKISPEPISEEWLLKFGFEREENFYRINISEMVHHPLYIHVHKVGYIATGDTSFDYWMLKKGNNFIAEQKQLQYVHQLQNLYFALTGEELTIKD